MENPMQKLLLTRRDLILTGTKLSAASVAILAGVGTAGIVHAARAADAVAPAATTPAMSTPPAMAPAASANKDVDILNVALGLEHQGIGAYQVGADSGLLKQPALNIVLLFQSHHKAHRDALTAAIQKLGGTPVAALSTAEYAKQLNASTLKTQDDILKLALSLELGATNAYISVIPTFQDHDLARLSGRLVADEAMHWTALAYTLGQPLPANAMMFGAA
jgi:bacterioferritin (cytochrome b1)